jgi:hypothetical protein
MRNLSKFLAHIPSSKRFLMKLKVKFFTSTFLTESFFKFKNLSIVPVDRPYPVHVPAPYPVIHEKKVPYIVEKHVKYPV